MGRLIVLIVLVFMLGLRCGYRSVYCDSIETIEKLSLGCEIIKMKERRLPPLYKVRLKCPKGEKCNDRD